MITRVGVAVLSGEKVRRETAGLTAPESVGRQCAQLRGSGADLAFGPRLVYGRLAFWMQTSGTALLVERCSLVRVCMAAQGSRSSHGGDRGVNLLRRRVRARAAAVGGPRSPHRAKMRATGHQVSVCSPQWSTWGERCCGYGAGKAVRAGVVLEGGDHPVLGLDRREPGQARALHELGRCVVR
jgi:hypothetical protein